MNKDARAKEPSVKFPDAIDYSFLWADNFQVTNCFQCIWGSVNLAFWGNAIVYSFTLDKQFPCERQV